VFPHLFSEITIGGCTIPNRIVSPGHHTYLSDREPNEELVAYHRARATGGTGLIISEVVAVHATATFSHNLLVATDRSVIPAFSRLTKACHDQGSRIFAQLFHPGREIVHVPDGLLPIAWAPSAVPNERFHIMPKPMPVSLIKDVVSGYGNAASILAEAGFDGFEIVASHGYLPAQFLNSRVNQRDDQYGGDADRRLKFVRDVVTAIRGRVPDHVLGLRISGTEMDTQGLTEEEVGQVCQAISQDIDYFSVTAGSSSGLASAVHIAPPMGMAPGYTAPLAGTIRRTTGVPVIVTGRINQPQVAEQILARGEADLCGMNRALICDPGMPGKAKTGQSNHIRACIGCNQACIGRAQKGLGISCIQNPTSGRELEYAKLPPVTKHKQIIVAGGGPAGMKAAAVAAKRGHEVLLVERDQWLGGQARLAQRLPGREEFGGIIDNLEREMIEAGVTVVTNTSITAEWLQGKPVDVLIGATGAAPYKPDLEGLCQPHVLTAWEVLEDEVNVGTSVAIADWRSDWIGIGVAEKLARAGSSVTLFVNAAMAGETIENYTRNHYLGRLHNLNVKIHTHARLFGTDYPIVYFQDTLTDEPIVIDEIDTLVLSLGHSADQTLERELAGSNIELHSIGDCVAPRTAEEAVYEGLQIGWSI
tara:strand:- start:99 stop:2039 length:1941 start_codon:yes stop_codon:yes gene_type:complete